MGIIYIGLSGKSNHGKDSAAQFIVDRFGKKTIVENGELQEIGYNIKRFAFADALKQEVGGKEKELCNKYNLPYEPDKKHRTLLQFYGMMRRKEDSNYWIKKLAKTIDSDKEVKVALITDLRFKNEAYWLKDRGKVIGNECYLVRINRQGYLNPDANNADISETDLDEFVEFGKTPSDDPFFAFEAHYSGGLDELKRDVITIFENIIEDLDVVGRFEKLMKEAAEKEQPIRIGLGIV